MTAGVSRRRWIMVTLWAAVIFLAFVGFTASVARGFGTLQSHLWTDGPVPEITRIDRGSTRLLATLLGAERGTAAYREIEIQNHRFLRKFNQFPTATLLHVLPAALLIVLAPMQFSRAIRSRHVRWHRWSGRLIVALGIPIGISGLFFGLLMPFAGVVEGSAIALFAGVFLFSLIRAFVAIRQRDIARHREWMIRMFAVAVGVSMVRVASTVLLVVTHEGPAAWFGQATWIGFGVTQTLAELWIRHTRRMAGSAGGVAIPVGAALPSHLAVSSEVR